MEYLTRIRRIRNILFKAFLITILFVLLMWLFIITDLMQYFMWALPGFTVETANLFTMWLVGALDIAGIVLFLIPTLALTWEIQTTKRILAMEAVEFAQFRAKVFEVAAKPVKTVSAAKAKPKAKPKKKK